MLVKLKKDMVVAMRAKEKLRLGTIRMLIAEINKAEIAKRSPLDEAETVTLLTREAKKRREAAELYKEGGRLELAEKEELELLVIQGYLPKAMGGEEVREIVQAIIERVQPQSQKDMGKVMGPLMPQIRGRFDGKAASAIVREEMAKALS